MLSFLIQGTMLAHMAVKSSGEENERLRDQVRELKKDREQQLERCNRMKPKGACPTTNEVISMLDKAIGHPLPASPIKVLDKAIGVPLPTSPRAMDTTTPL